MHQSVYPCGEGQGSRRKSEEASGEGWPVSVSEGSLWAARECQLRGSCRQEAGNRPRGSAPLACSACVVPTVATDAVAVAAAAATGLEGWQLEGPEPLATQKCQIQTQATAGQVGSLSGRSPGWPLGGPSRLVRQPRSPPTPSLLCIAAASQGLELMTF